MRLPRPGTTLFGNRRRVVVVVAVLAALVVLGVPTLLVLRGDGGEAPGGRDGDGDRGAASSAGAAATCAGKPLRAARELRGMWLTTVNNIDWPSRRGLDAETIKAEYRTWLDLAERRRHNAIFVHVRPSGDALWPSTLAPWSEWLTGVRGQDPGFDPLAFAIAEAHARNLEFHAWFNPYRGSQPASVGGAGPDVDKLAPDHALRTHPEWAAVYPRAGTTGSRLHYNPGVPDARRYVEDAMLDAVRRYDVDGVHFDDFFYPYPTTGQDFPDDDAFARYGTGFANKADWRRDNVNTLVREMAERIKEIKPWVKFGISPFGIWRNARTDPIGSPTRGLQAYDEIYADTKLWVEREWLDYIVPQLYWHIGFEIADYAKLLPWWTSLTGRTRVQLYIGQADYRVGEKGAWSDPAELDRQLALNRQLGAQGSVHFSAKSVRTDALGAVSRYADVHYAAPALVPVMAHIPGRAPAAPQVTVGADRLTWRPAAGPAPAMYAVYRVDGDAARLVATTRAASWPLTGAGTYCVTGLDRLWNEGAASTARVAS